MVKKISFLLIISLLVGCLSHKTEYGRKRLDYNRLSTKPNTNNAIYKIIDTTKLYRLISKDYDALNKQLGKTYSLHLKFYNNGRVGQFFSYKESDITSLDPKRARMGIYNYSNNKLHVEYYLETPQGDGLVDYEFNIEKNKDTLKLVDKEYSFSYKEVPLAKDFLIYKPDW
jgi:hypothetical protein